MSDTSDTDSYAGSAASVAAEENTAERQITEKINSAFDPMRFDKSIALEARHSGLLNAERIDLQTLVTEISGIQKEYTALQQNYEETVQLTTQNLDWLDAHISDLNDKVRRKYPIEHALAEESVLNNLSTK